MTFRPTKTAITAK